MDKLIILTGATGVGKSKLAVFLAEKYNGEIVGADSMQIYRGMDIGTGKIREDEKCGIKHHLIDIANPDQEYSVGQYVLDATAAIEEILSRNKLPIVAGGTGLYLTSFLLNHTFAGAPKNEAVRDELKRFVEENGPDALYELLKEKDPASAEKISPADIKRVIRALEIYLTTGKPKSELANPQAREAQYDYLCIVLQTDRNILYENIEKRIDKMMDDGLIDEVKKLVADLSANKQSAQAIGYKEILEYLKNGAISRAEAVCKLKLNTRHYAKRQITYFKNMPLNKRFINVNNIEEIYAAINDFLG